ncbi:MAG TPA: hypothetical protein VES73_18795 [Lamprocystis sp. (in: g-proteobacteria)]|nr:hypothetical protein [Lamprocystis sp. (in: g-proteobacteria)]
MSHRWLLLTLFLPWFAVADPAAVMRFQTTLQVDTAYGSIYKALEAGRFWVAHEANLGEQMARSAAARGADYNRNRLGAARAMVFSSSEWTATLANADPDLLALIPLHLTIYERDGATHIVVPRLSVMAKGSPGESRAAELEAEIRGILRQVLEEERL